MSFLNILTLFLNLFYGKGFDLIGVGGAPQGRDRLSKSLCGLER
tara:strand:+ start:58 stop:189 length:132 start_codon:yes stop_codon:yes gene_type:complete